MEQEHICKKCAIVKSESVKFKNNRICSSCANALMREYNKTPERRAYMRARDQTKERKEYCKKLRQTAEHKAYMREYRQDERHKERIVALSQKPERIAWVSAYEKSQERVERKKIYRKTYEKCEKYKSRAKALKATAKYREQEKAYKKEFGGTHYRRSVKRGNHAERFRRTDIFRRDGFVCEYCQKKLKQKECVLEHRIPIAKGGSHTPENCTTSCQPCNAKKNDKLINGLQITIFDNVKA